MEKIKEKCIFQGNCWVWNGSFRKEDGRPTVRWNGKATYPHLITWKLFGNDHPARKEMLKVTCVTEYCINPEHWVKVTRKPANDKYHPRRWNDLLKMSKQEGECLLWTGAIDPMGYGYASYHRKPLPVHRISWIIHNGVPKSGHIVRHKCKNKICFCPSHLEIGTHQQNLYDDKIRDGTLLYGEKHWNSTITEKKARAILDSHKEGSIEERATKFGVSTHIIKNIDNHNTWCRLNPKRQIYADKLRKRRKELKEEAKKTPPTQKYIRDRWTKIRSKCNEENGCWLYQSHLNPKGYALVLFHRSNKMLHVVSWEIHCNGGNPKPQGMYVRHRCKNKHCCNPDHLFLSDKCADKKK